MEGPNPNFDVHSLSFIRNAYKEQFSQLVKYFEKIRNTLVIFLKVREQTLFKIGEKYSFSSKKSSLYDIF